LVLVILVLLIILLLELHWFFSSSCPYTHGFWTCSSSFFLILSFSTSLMDSSSFLFTHPVPITSIMDSGSFFFTHPVLISNVYGLNSFFFSDPVTITLFLLHCPNLDCLRTFSVTFPLTLSELSLTLDYLHRFFSYSVRTWLDFGLSPPLFLLLCPNLAHLWTISTTFSRTLSELGSPSDFLNRFFSYSVRTWAHLRTFSTAFPRTLSELGSPSDFLHRFFSYSVRTWLTFGLSPPQFPLLCPNLAHIRTFSTTVSLTLSELGQHSDNLNHFFILQ
jgi:hypothetical protein